MFLSVSEMLFTAKPNVPVAASRLPWVIWSRINAACTVVLTASSAKETVASSTRCGDEGVCRSSIIWAEVYAPLPVDPLEVRSWPGLSKDHNVVDEAATGDV